MKKDAKKLIQYYVTGLLLQDKGQEAIDSILDKL